MEIYLQGLTMGLAYVAPIGLQNLFVINTAITQPKRRAYLTALIDNAGIFITGNGDFTYRQLDCRKDWNRPD